MAMSKTTAQRLKALRAKAAEQKKAAVPRISRNLLRWMMGVTSLLLVAGGVAVGMNEEGWQFLTALYVVVQITTTIGYGDVCVETPHMKIIMTFYILSLLMVVAYCINVAIERCWARNAHFMTRQLYEFEQILERKSNAYWKCVHKCEDYKGVLRGSLVMVSFVLVGTIFYATYENCSCSYGVTHVKDCIGTTYEECVETGGYVKSWVDAYYMSVVTLTTVGFGDHSPRTHLGRALGLPWMIIGVVIAAYWINEMRMFFYSLGAHKHVSKEDDHDTFHEQISPDGHGLGLTKAEYRCYMLLKMHLVTKEQLTHIDDHFNRMQFKLGSKGHVTFGDLQTIREDSSYLKAAAPAAPDMSRSYTSAI